MFCGSVVVKAIVTHVASCSLSSPAPQSLPSPCAPTLPSLQLLCLFLVQPSHSQPLQLSSIHSSRPSRRYPSQSSRSPRADHITQFYGLVHGSWSNTLRMETMTTPPKSSPSLLSLHPPASHMTNVMATSHPQTRAG